MKKAREFDNILNECLERLLSKGGTIEQCLAGYSEYAAELEPLLRTALDAKEAIAIKPRPEFRERASYQFQAALREMELKKSRGFFSWQPRWATAVIVVIALLLAGSGTVAAASNSMPDEPLYQVKLATETVRLALTPSALGKQELYVKLVDKRVDEIIKMADEGKAEQVEKATEKLDGYLVAVSNLAAREESTEGNLATSGAEQPEVTEAPQIQMTAPVPAPAPGGAPSVEETPPAAAEEAPRLATPRAPGPPEEAGQGKGGGAEKGVKPDKQAKLREVLARQAIENQEALRAELERAPESVKPALRKAIEKASAGYEQALQNLD